MMQGKKLSARGERVGRICESGFNLDFLPILPDTAPKPGKCGM